MPDEETTKNIQDHQKEIDSYKIERSLLSDAYFQLKDTTNKLETSEERFRRLAENAPDVIYRMSLSDGKYEYISPAASSVLGYSAEEFYQNPALFKDILLPKWKDYFEGEYKKLLNGEMPSTYEYQILRKDGETRWLNQRNILVRDADGKPVAIEGIVTDVTESKESEEIRKTHLRFMENMDKVNRAMQGATELDKMLNDVLQVTIDIFGCDRAKVIFPCDPSAPSWHVAAARITPGCPQEQVIGFEVAMTPRVAEEFRVQLATPGPMQRHTEKESILLRSISSTAEPKSTMSTVLYPRVGKAWQFILEQCSTDRVWTKEEEELFQEIARRFSDALTILLAYCDINENETQMRALINTIPDLVWLKDTHGVYISCNPEFERFFGAKEAEIVGKTDFDFVDRELAEFFLKKDLEAIAAGSPSVNEEWVTYASDGHRALLETIKTPVRDSAGNVTGVLGVARDITARKKSEEEHTATLKYMESMDRVNRAIQSAGDLEKMMSDVLDEVLDIFECDRAWLLTPCDPWVTSYRVPMERARPGFPGALALGIEVPVDPETVPVLQKARATDGPVTFDAESDPPIPSELIKHFGIQSQMVLDIYPKVEESWMFGIHQCSHRRIWTDEEKKLFQEIGRRISDALTALLVHRDLVKREEEYGRIVETANEGILVIDKNRKLVFMNARFLQILGYEQKDILTHKIDEFIAPEDVEKHEDEMKRRSGGSSSVYTRRFLRKDGAIVLCRVSAVPLFNSNKEFDGSFAMITDITESSHVEEKLKEQIKFSDSLLRFSRKVEQSQTYGEVLAAAQEEIRTIVGYTNVWAYRLDDDKKYAHSIVASGPTAGMVMSEDVSATLKITGDPMLEAIASAKEIVIVEDAMVDPNVNREIVEKMKNRTIVNVPIVLFDRNLGSIGMGTFGDEGVRVPTKSEQEYLIAMASHMAVAFDRIRLLGQQNENEEELKEAQRIGNFGSFDWNSKTDEAVWSEEFYRIYGIDPSKKAPTLSEYIKLHTPESAEILTKAAETLGTTEEPYNLSLEFVRPDGLKRWVAFRAEAKFDENHNYIGARGIAQDVTRAREIEKMRVDFLSLASHQLRTPLSGTRWLIETLEKGLPGPLTKGQQEYLDEIHKINDRMTRLVSDMLVALRVESTESVIIKKPISIEQLFNDLMLSVGAAAKSRGIVIRDDSIRHPIPHVESDMNFLSIILSTFLSNAINYSSDEKEIIFDVVAEDDGVAISVRDFGIGIPPEEQAHVYERFFRAVNAKMVRPEGTGLGLYIASIIAEKLRGKITFTSELGKGTTFVLHLPAK